VDDGPGSRRILNHWYDRWKLETSSVANRKQAVTAMRKAAKAGQPFDLAIIDAELPQGDAFEIAAAMRADGKHKDTRLVLLTALDYEDNTAELHRSGFDAQLTKPLKVLPMFECLTRILNGAAPAPRQRNTVVAETPSADPAVGHLKILVAEDSPVNQKVILYQLNKLGYSADLVTDGVAVVGAVLTKAYDIVLLDCQMPKLDGYEATQQIRAQEQNRHVWIIAMTAHALTGDRERCLAVGMDDYIGKPVRLGDLRSALERFGASEDRHSNQPSLNTAVLEDLRNSSPPGKTMFQELIEVFLQTSPKVLSDLRAAVDVRNAQQVAQAAHLLRGSSINFGAERLCFLCEQLEHAAAQDSLDIAGTLTEDAEREYERVRQMLERELAACAT
jgi:two-component system, sensor histidine kinase and response regulator